MKPATKIACCVLAISLLLSLAGCGVQTPLPAVRTPPPVATQVPPTATLVQPSPTFTPVQLTKADLVEKALASAEALQASNGFAFASTVTALTKLKITSGDQTLQESTELLSYVDKGSRFSQGGNTNITWRRNVYFPGSNSYPLNSEMRLVDGQVYLRAAFNQPKPDLPAMPNQWVRVNGASTLLYWPNTADLSLASSLAEIREDAWALLSGHSLQRLRQFLTGDQANVQHTISTLVDGSPADILTFEINSAWLKDTLRFPPADTPSNEKLLSAIEGYPGEMIFTLDTSGQLVAWEQSVRIDIQKIDFSNIEGAPQGSRVDIQAEENVAVTISRDGLPPLASAPASSEMIELPSYSGSASGAFFPTLEAFDIRLNAALQDGKLDSFWQEFSAAKTMPLVFGDLAVFLYRGEEKSVTWPADWSNYRLFGTGRLGTSDLWMHTVRLPLDARLEYQIQLDGKQLITDPLNPIVETGGLGSKSVVQMPGYVSPEYVLPQEGVLQGTLTENNLISSKSLGYDVNYRVYTPAGYEKMRRLPVLYVTDGQDFLAFGKLEVALDNLIAGGKIRPVMAVFIDPRDTKTGENLREKQFLDNPKYGDFIASELVPQIDRSYHSDPSPDARAIVGASYGGYFVSTFVLSHSDIFHLAACLSPSFWRNPKVIENYRKIDRLPLKFFVSTGIFNDTDYHSRLFKEMLEDMGYPLRYIESNEGHSYGNWRGKFEQMLAYLIPPT